VSPNFSFNKWEPLEDPLVVLRHDFFIGTREPTWIPSNDRFIQWYSADSFMPSLAIRPVPDRLPFLLGEGDGAILAQRHHADGTVFGAHAGL